MKTAQEILLEERTARLQREAADRSWAEMINRCRTPRWQAPLWSQEIGLILLVGYLLYLYVSGIGGHRGVLFVSAIFIFINVPLYFINRRRREKALLAIVEMEAPQLYRKLQHEGIA